MNLNKSALPNKATSVVQKKPSFKNLRNNQNYLQCKFHTNKFQENLLNKRLKQLDVDEMKTRLKSQRDSNELINFLVNCQTSTGYLDAKLNAHKTGNVAKLIKLNQPSKSQSKRSNLDTLQSQKYRGKFVKITFKKNLRISILSILH